MGDENSMKRFITLFMVLAMLISACPIATAVGEGATEAARAAELFTSLGILDKGFDDFDSDAKRGFTVSIASKLIASDINVGYTDKYKDVFEATQYMREILFMSDMGYIDGYDNNEFLPDNPITYGEFSKMLVMMLDYGYEAKAYGGYPNGYIQLMNNLKLSIAGKTAGSRITNADMLAALYNAMMVKKSSMDIISGSTIMAGNGESMLEMNNVFQIKGVVSQASGTSVGYDTADTCSDEIKIGDYVMKTALSNPIEYLGKTVTAYVRDVDDGAEYELLSVIKTEYEKENIIEAGTESSISWVRNSDNTITLKYYASNKSKRITLPGNTMYYYNGRLTTDYAVIEDALGMTQGSIRVLETSESTYVFLNEYFDIIVSGIDTDDYVLRDSLIYGKIKIPADDSSAFVGIHTDEGDIDFNSISSGDIISVFMSIDGTYVDMYIHNEKISGTLTSKSGDKYVVDGTEYELNEGIAQAIAKGKKTFNKIKPNDSVTFSINKFGRVVDVELSRNDLTYAYLYKTVFLENEPEYEDYIAMFKLYNVERNETSKYFAKDNIMVNGVRYKTIDEAQSRISALINEWGSSDMLVKVKYSGDEEITAIEIPIRNSDDTDRLRWAANYDNTTPEEVTRVGGKYIYDSNTLILEVYEGEEVAEKKATNYLQKDFTKEHNYELYDADELNFIGAMVLRVKSGFEMDNSAIYYGDPVYIVKSTGEAWMDDESEKVNVIKAYSDGGTMTQELVVTTDTVYNIDTNIDSVFKDMCYNVPTLDGVRYGQYGYKYLDITDIRKGDIIQVERDVLGKVNRFRVLARLSELDGYFDNVAFGGRINNPYSMLTYGEISYMNRRAFVVDYTGGQRTYITENVPVLIYNRTSNSIEGGSMADIGEGARVIVRAKKFKLSFIIVVED